MEADGVYELRCIEVEEEPQAHHTATHEDDKQVEYYILEHQPGRDEELQGGPGGGADGARPRRVLRCEKKKKKKTGGARHLFAGAASATDGFSRLEGSYLAPLFSAEEKETDEVEAQEQLRRRSRERTAASWSLKACCRSGIGESGRPV